MFRIDPDLRRLAVWTLLGLVAVVVLFALLGLVVPHVLQIDWNGPVP